MWPDVLDGAKDSFEERWGEDKKEAQLSWEDLAVEGWVDLGSFGRVVMARQKLDKTAVVVKVQRWAVHQYRCPGGPEGSGGS